MSKCSMAHSRVHYLWWWWLAKDLPYSAGTGCSAFSWTGRLLASLLSTKDRPKSSHCCSATRNYLMSHWAQCVILQPSFMSVLEQNLFLCKSRSVPFALKESLGKELDRLEEQGILRRVNHSDWAASVVPVPKVDGSLRLCGDYKVTVNSSLNQMICSLLLQVVRGSQN